ncbi:GtrA family protein [Cohnella sp. GCM10020058]|uniref:GtrA family protein n=1 Tax=Cohnella sp. GCM10020058 TaxID=3317330 RepID=UPI003637BBFA
MKYLTEIIKFVLVGLINTFTTYFVYLGFLHYLPYIAAYSISYGFGIIISYFLNSLLVFKEKLSWKSFFKFPLIYVVQYGLNTLLLYIFVHHLMIHERIALLVSIIITTPLTFLLSRWIIKSRTNKLEQ